MIEGSNIEYGDIEKCNIDTKITSKIWRLVTSKKSDGNIEFIINLFNIDSKTGSNGGSNGVIASPIIISRGPPHPTGTPFDPVFTVDVK